MKYQRFPALFIVLALILSGCALSAPASNSHFVAETKPFYEDEIPEMGDIYLSVDKEPTKEAYTKARVRVDWSEGNIEEQSITIKLRGNSSTSSGKKSYNIKFPEKISFMHMGEGKKWSLLSNPFDKSLIRIALAFEYAEALEIPYVSQFRYCRLWMNEQYMGVYVVMEPIGDGKDRIDIDVLKGDAIFECDKDRTEEGVTYITAYPDIRMQINEPESPSAEQANVYETFLQAAYKAMATKDHKEYEKYIDIDSFVNFYIFNEVVKDIDFGEFSTRYYLKNGKLHAGPPWDMDLSMGNVSRAYNDPKYHRYYNKYGFGDRSEDSTTALWLQSGYYAELIQDPYFCELVSKRWEEMLPVTRNLFESNELGENLIDRYTAAYAEEFASNYGPENTGWAVWYQEGLYADQALPVQYEGQIEDLRIWLSDRVDWLDSVFSSPIE